MNNVNVMPPMSIKKFFGDVDGPKLLVLGAVHGNEICGTKAIYQVIEEIESGNIKIIAGSVTFIPITNPKAYNLGLRRGDRDLNRGLKKFKYISSFEDRIANVLTNIMEECDVLLDLHSFRAVGDGFIFVGPEDNTGNLEPFYHAEKELRFSQSLGLNRMVYGWLSSYKKFVIEQHNFLDTNKGDKPAIVRAEKDFGIGTTEYFRSIGKFGVTVECGNHFEQKSVDVAYHAICNALAYLGITGDRNFKRCPFTESYKFSHIIIRHHEKDTLSRIWNSFDSVSKGEVLAIRHTGETIAALNDGIVIFSYKDAKAGAEWIYYAEVSNRGKI